MCRVPVSSGTHCTRTTVRETVALTAAAIL
jgi:hypothetical protein